MAWFEGKAGAASQSWQQAGSRATQDGDPLVAAQLMAGEALARAMLGWTVPVGPIADRALQRSREPEVLAVAALAFAFSGQPGRAQALVDEHQRHPRVKPGSDAALVASTRAVLALKHGRPKDAIEFLSPLRPYDLGSRFEFLPSYVRGVAYLDSGLSREAVTEFERIANHRTISPAGVTTPLGWLHLARARRLAGDFPGAIRAYARVLGFWRDADADLPVLAAARAEEHDLARLVAAAGDRRP